MEAKGTAGRIMPTIGTTSNIDYRFDSSDLVLKCLRKDKDEVKSRHVEPKLDLARFLFPIVTARISL